MKLVQPTDFEILGALSDGRRNNAINLAKILDQERNYMNTRLSQLSDYGLIETVGPAENNGLYVITEKGKEVLDQREEYEQGNT